MPLADAKDDGFLASAAPCFALDATRAEVAFVYFNRATEQTFKLALLGYAFAHTSEKAFRLMLLRPHPANKELRDLDRHEYGGHVTQELYEN